MLKDIFSIAKLLLPVGINLAKDLKKARKKKNAKELRRLLLDSRTNYDALRERLFGE